MPDSDATPMSQADYVGLIENSPVPIVVHGPDSRVVDANPAFAELLGYTVDEVLNMHAHDIVHPDSHEIRDEQAERLLSQDHRTMDVVRRLVRKDGTSIWAKVRKSSIERPDGVVVMVFFEDWTEQRWDDPFKFPG